MIFLCKFSILEPQPGQEKPDKVEDLASKMRERVNNCFSSYKIVMLGLVKGTVATVRGQCGCGGE